MQSVTSRRPTHRCASRTLVLFVLALTASVRAQTTPTASRTSNDPEDETKVVLSPFTVATDKDEGYAAANTLAGSRLNTALANTPAPISVMTRDFLDDIGAVDAKQAIEYSLGGVNDTTDGTGNQQTWNAFNYQIRGFRGGTNSKNYFRSSFLADSFNVERLELARGPNSILYGIGSPGGTFNSSTKQALLNRDLTSVQLRVGSFDEFRSTLDVSRAFNSQFAVRVNALYHDSRGVFDFEVTRRKAAALAATWRPLANTTIRVDADVGHFDDQRARPFAVQDGYTAWVQAGRPLVVTFGGTAAQTATLGAGVIVAPQSPLGATGGANISGTFRASNNPAIRGFSSTGDIMDETIVPRSVNLLGPGTGNVVDFETQGLFVEQKVGRNLFLEAAYYRQKQNYLNRRGVGFNDERIQIDVNSTFPVYDANGVQTGTQPNPNVGKYLVRGVYTDSDREELQEDMRVTANYNLDLGRAGYHRIAALVQRTENESDNIVRTEKNIAANRAAANILNTVNDIRRVTYLDFSRSDGLWRGQHAPESFPVSGRLLGSTFNVQSGLANTNWTKSFQRVDTTMAALQSNFFKERLWTTFGARRDAVKNYGSTPIRDAVSTEFLGATLNSTPSTDVTDTTTSMGVVFHITPWLSVFANQSDNFGTQGNQFYGESGQQRSQGNILGEGRDVGLRSKLWGGRINVSLAYYETEQLNQNWFISGNFRNVVNAIWPVVGQPARATLLGDDVQDVISDGWEFEAIANPNRNLRVSFNVSKSYFVQTRSLDSVMEYLNANRSIWLSPENANRPVTGFAQGTTVRELYDFLVNTQVQQDLRDNDKQPFAHRPWKANVFANYTFREGALKNWSFGLGGNYRGPMILGYRNNNTEKIEGYEQFFVNALLGYERKIWKGIRAKFQLNVDNIFDFDDPFPRNWAYFDDTQSNTIARQFITNPRRWSLTSTFSF